jgi:hypothetical protein
MIFKNARNPLLAIWKYEFFYAYKPQIFKKHILEQNTFFNELLVFMSIFIIHSLYLNNLSSQYRLTFQNITSLVWNPREEN